MSASPGTSRHHSPPSGSTLSREPRSWMLFRFFLGLGGAALVLLPVASGNNYIFSVVGLVMFIAAVLFFPAKPRTTLDEKTRELNALAVVDGGRYRFPNSKSSVPVQLFVAADRISVLDAKFRLLLEIPTSQITSFLVLEESKAWFLEVIWTTYAAEFFYRGALAERLAHAAENAIRRVAPVPAPVVPQRRAASA